MGKKAYVAEPTQTLTQKNENTNGLYQPAKLVLSTDFGVTDPNQTPLLSFLCIETLFHEFGHALQTLLSRTEHQCIAGTRVPLDFVEIFSTLMEFFVYDPNICTKFSAHYITGEPIGIECVEGVSRSKCLFTALETQMQIFYSLLDLAYHSE